MLFYLGAKVFLYVCSMSCRRFDSKKGAIYFTDPMSSEHQINLTEPYYLFLQIAHPAFQALGKFLKLVFRIAKLSHGEHYVKITRKSTTEENVKIEHGEKKDTKYHPRYCDMDENNGFVPYFKEMDEVLKELITWHDQCKEHFGTTGEGEEAGQVKGCMGERAY